MKVLEKLRAGIIHKLNGLTMEETLRREYREIRSYTAVPQKVSARVILQDGREYPQAVIHQQLGVKLMDAVIENGYVSFNAEEDPQRQQHIIRADLWVIKREDE